MHCYFIPFSQLNSIPRYATGEFLQNKQWGKFSYITTVFLSMVLHSWVANKKIKSKYNLAIPFVINILFLFKLIFSDQQVFKQF